MLQMEYFLNIVQNKCVEFRLYYTIADLYEINTIYWRYLMASLFDEREKSPLFQLTFILFIVVLMALNNNEKIADIPYAYISFRLIQITFSIYVSLNVAFLLKDKFKEQKNRKPAEKIQVFFIALFLILLVFVTIESIIHIISYIRLNLF